jgi:predicted ribosome quality control (RQC) complex YloA/Tae2 family protein
MERLTTRDFNGKAKPIQEIDSSYLTQILEKIAHYEDLEEQGMLLKLNTPADILIRCTICTNPIKSDRGCDGNCTYDERLFDKLMKQLTNEDMKNRINHLEKVLEVYQEEINDQIDKLKEQLTDTINALESDDITERECEELNELYLEIDNEINRLRSLFEEGDINE